MTLAKDQNRVISQIEKNSRFFLFSLPYLIQVVKLITKNVALLICQGKYVKGKFKTK